jgi:hypothetical protein
MDAAIDAMSVQLVVILFFLVGGGGGLEMRQS